MKTKTLAIAAALAAGGAAHAQEAVQWRVEDGGNGHWYQVRPREAIVDFPEALAYSESLGASFAASSNGDEWLFITTFVLASLPSGSFATIGVRQAPDGAEPAGGWTWLDGSRFAIPWGPGEPSESLPGEDWAHVARYPNGVIYVNDCIAPFDAYSFFITIEWSADCNGDGIVDYGQILDGTFEDTNGNGVPDCCDEGVSCDPCVGDVNFDGIVNGADISVLLGFWGLNGKPVAADINKDGQVDGADLAQMLGSWGECP